MILDNFSELVSRIVDNEFPIREIPITYNMSMKWIVDEINSEKHFNMSFPEYLEALCRVIDKASPIPDGERSEDWSKSRREEQSLVQKLSNVLHLLVKNITHPECKYVKEKFPLPNKEKGLYTFDTTLPFYQGLIIDTKPKNSSSSSKY
jgi:hypothetical protein